MNSRRRALASARKIFPALMILAAGAASPLLAQTQSGAPNPDAIPAPEASTAAAPAVQPEPAPALSAAPAPIPSAPAPSAGGVFDAPGMPGVRMMAPIPDGAAPEPGIVAAPQGAPTAAPQTSVSIPPATNGASVFDAPGMPGVRMMAPIPDGASVFAPAPPPAPAIRQPTTIAPASDPRTALTQAFASAKRGDWSRALRFADQASSRTGALIIQWLYLTDDGSDAGFAQINAFLNAHPNWPRHDAMLARAENAMPLDVDPRLVIEWFGDRTPLTTRGLIRLGEAQLVAGNPDKGVQLIRKAWVEGSFSQADESKMLSVHGDILSEANHRARLDQLLALDNTIAAKRQMDRVDANARRVADARLRLRASPVAVGAVLASLPPELQSNPGFLYDAARAFRVRGQDEEAANVLVRTATHGDVNITPEQWWSTRHTMARDALKDRRYDVAYALASKHELESGAGFADAEFLAGWIALRFLHKPETALKHFQTLADGVSLPISVARAHYWLGRAEEELQHPNEAIAQYRRAAQHPESFYGQLALARAEERPTLRLPAVSQAPTRAEETAFENDERIAAIRVLSDLKDRSLARLFAIRVANDPPNAKKLYYLAQLMVTLGDQAMSVRVAKLASYNGVMLVSHLAPVVTLPRFRGNTPGPDPALVLGITRQESEFDTGVISSSGARGLMQLMPATARQAASMNRLAYRLSDLTANPQYNMQLGMATLDDYITFWGGSYVLAIAAYNAGPSNVRKWVEQNGDPRDPSVDPVDWIELIPFTETRNYVQRVLENTEIYRSRLGGGDQRLAILLDLYRPKAPELIVVKNVPVAPADVPIPVQKPETTALQ